MAIEKNVWRFITGACQTNMYSSFASYLTFDIPKGTWPSKHWDMKHFFISKTIFYYLSNQTELINQDESYDSGRLFDKVEVKRINQVWMTDDRKALKKPFKWHFPIVLLGTAQCISSHSDGKYFEKWRQNFFKAKKKYFLFSPLIKELNFTSGIRFSLSLNVYRNLKLTYKKRWLLK